MVKTIRIGSDFSGLDTSVIAMRKVAKKVPGLHVRHTHSCDNNKVCSNSILHNSPPEKFFDDVLTRSLDGAPECDVYCFIAPCTAFSPAGKNKGIADPNGALVFAAIMYIQEKRPVVVLSENVANFAQMHKATMQLVADTIRGLGYEVTWRMLSTDDFGIHQIRRLLHAGSSQ